MALGEKIAFEALEPANGLTGKPAHLCQLTSDRSRFGTDALADGILDLAWKCRLELGRQFRQCLDLGPRPLQGGIDVTRARPTVCRLLYPFLRACDCRFVHGLER